MKSWLRAHPDLTTWTVLSVGFVAVLSWTARDEGLGPAQWFWLSVAAVLTAGLCAWIISWEADDEEAGEPAEDDGR